jgi:hypothetical protein
MFLFSIVEWIVLGIVLSAGIALSAWWARKHSVCHRLRQMANAQRQFHSMREQLEAKFLDTASRSGRPRGLLWADCEFENDVTFARDRQSGRLCAFVAVTIKFEAVLGGGMEEVAAVSNAKYATAVFYYDPKRYWMTDGRAIFNLNPSEAVRHFQATLEPVGSMTRG